MSQEVWKNSKQEVLYFDGSEPRTDWARLVRLGSGQIEVSYQDDEGETVRYFGSEAGVGHYELSAPDAEGRATLHMFMGSRILEGYWSEGNSRGMWRIVLA
jgi:hypothetical protein